VRVDSPELPSEIVEGKMKSAVSGNIVPITELESVTDWASVKKVRYIGFSLLFPDDHLFKISFSTIN
jgi:hypothetical protein